MTEEKGLLQLPDEILIEILALLPDYELMAVSRASQKLNSLRLATKALRRLDMDFSGHAFNLDEMSKVLEYLDEQTNSLTLEGLGYEDNGWTHIKPETPEESAMCNITGPLMTGLSSHCESLKQLTLKNAWLPFGKIKIEHFPQSLTHLTLIGGKVYHRLFENCENSLANLEYLRVEEVTHFCAANWEAIKKLKKIETLILRKCGSVRFSVSRTLRDRENFPRLKVLDLSESGRYGVGYCSSFYLLPLRELSLTGDFKEDMLLNHSQAEYFVNSCGDDERALMKKTVEKLTLVRSILDDDALETIARHFSNLSHVSLIKCRGITDVGVINFENMLKEKNSSCEVVYEEALPDDCDDISPDTLSSEDSSSDTE